MLCHTKDTRHSHTISDVLAEHLKEGGYMDQHSVAGFHCTSVFHPPAFLGVVAISLLQCKTLTKSNLGEKWTISIYSCSLSSREPRAGTQSRSPWRQDLNQGPWRNAVLWLAKLPFLYHLNLPLLR